MLPLADLFVEVFVLIDDAIRSRGPDPTPARAHELQSTTISTINSCSRREMRYGSRRSVAGMRFAPR